MQHPLKSCFDRATELYKKQEDAKEEEKVTVLSVTQNLEKSLKINIVTGDIDVILK